MPVQCHVDLDANENAFIDLFYAQENNFDLIFLRNSVSLFTFDDSLVVSDVITHYCSFSFRKKVEAHQNTKFYVIKLLN